MRKAARYLLTALLAGLLLYLLAAWLLSRFQTRPQPVSCTSRDTLYLTTNGVHLNFVLPAGQLAANTLDALQVPVSAAYLSFGWGDKGFYLQTPRWKDLRPSVAARALFWKSESAIHVDYYARKHPSWVAVALCPEQYSSLKQYIMAAFRRKPNGQFTRIDHPGYGDSDQFFEAHGSYSLFYTCNNWVNAGLKHAGVPTAVWSPFDRGVLRHFSNSEEN